MKLIDLTDNRRSSTTVDVEQHKWKSEQRKMPKERNFKINLCAKLYQTLSICLTQLQKSYRNAEEHEEQRTKNQE